MRQWLTGPEFLKLPADYAQAPAPKAPAAYERKEKKVAKDLTNTDKSDSIWEQLKAEAKKIGHGSLLVELVIHDNRIVEAKQKLGEKRFRAE